MSRASTLPGHAGKGFRGLQLGGASRAKLEGAAVKAWLGGTSQLGLGGICPVLVHPRSPSEEHKICVGDGTVRALAMASLSGLFSSLSARLGGFSV